MFRTLRVCFMAAPFVAAACLAGSPLAAADDLSDLKPGTKVIVDLGGESVGEVVQRVAPGVYRVRVKIRTGDVITPDLPAARLRRAPADAIGGATPSEANGAAAAPEAGAANSSGAGSTGGSSGASDSGTAPPTVASSGTVTVTPGTATAGSVTPGTVTPGTVTPGTVTPGTVTPGTVTPGTVTPGSATQGAVVQGKVTVTPGTVSPGSVTPGKVTPGSVTQGTTPAVTITQGTATPGRVTPGRVTPGTVTPGTATSGTATSGTATSGTVIVTPGTAGPGAENERPLPETPAGKAELRSLAGVWQVVSSARNGQPDPRAPKTVTITPTSITLDQIVFDQVRVDPTSTPRRMDLATTGGDRPVRAIYERDGNRLRICLMPGDASVRPTAFETIANDGRVLYECELAQRERS